MKLPLRIVIAGAGLYLVALAGQTGLILLGVLSGGL
jgi:hypothetical protein